MKRPGEWSGASRLAIDRLLRDLCDDHREYMRTHPNLKSPSKEWRQICFQGKLDILGRGYQVKYAEFRLEAPAAAAPPPRELDRSVELQAALTHLGEIVAAEAGHPLSDIRITVAVRTGIGELSCTFTPGRV